MTDKELIQQIVDKKNQKAFEDLVNRYQLLVIKTCMGFTSSYADAEDLAQEVFIEVYQSLEKFRNEAKLSTWIYRIAINKSLNFIRKQKRERFFKSIESFFNKDNSYESIQLSDETNLADKRISNLENKQLLKNAIAKLPENQRIAFILSKYQELSYKEIAEVMGVTLSSVESLLFRAKSNLQKIILSDLKK